MKTIASERPLADLRRDMLLALAELVQADAGHWSWGRGHPASNGVTPLAFIHFGYTESELHASSQFSLDSRMREEFALPLMQHLRSDNVACVMRRDLIPDERWHAGNWLCENVRRTGMNSWIQAVRYAANDTWSNLFLARRLDCVEFAEDERDVVDLAIMSISWLWANPLELVPQAAFKGLSPQQRAVMLHTLGGLSRKRIAASMGISKETVNHHLKAVFQHFAVHSATELAGLFLKSR